MGGSVHGKLTIKDSEGEFETPIEYYVVDLNVRIPSQTVDKGIAVSDSKGVNAMTGQVNSASKMTSPETGLLYGLGLDKVLEEILKVRGGDEGLQKALSIMLSKTGNVSMDTISKFSSGVTSTESLDALFKSIHIKIFDE